MDGVPREVIPGAQSPIALRGPESSEELDPELLALPDPPRGGRTLTVAVLAAAAALALALAFALRRDVAFALRGGASDDLGDLHLTPLANLASDENRLVRAEALLGAAGGIRYERPLVDDTFRTLPVAGRPDVWVDVRVPAGQETGRWEPPRSFVGRLVRFGAAGPRHRGLADAIARVSRTDVPAGAFLLVDGEAPEDVRWTILLAATFVACAAWNLISISRIVRRVK